MSKSVPNLDNNWKKIWEKKGNQEVDGNGLDQLLIYAGYDSITAKITGDAFRTFVASICSKVCLGETDRILEVGCGIGAFLHCVKPAPADIVGIDYSQSLISRAEKSKSDPRIKFYQAEADNFSGLGLGTFDVIFSNGVFFYFPSLEYARRACRQIFKSLNASGRVAVLDIADAEKKDQFLAMRYAEVGETQYKELYRGLDHIFYEKTFFLETFRALGCAKISIEDQSFAGYKNSPYRFNVFVWK